MDTTFRQVFLLLRVHALLAQPLPTVWLVTVAIPPNASYATLVSTLDQTTPVLLAQLDAHNVLALLLALKLNPVTSSWWALMDHTVVKPEPALLLASPAPIHPTIVWLVWLAFRLMARHVSAIDLRPTRQPSDSKVFFHQVLHSLQF
jgi:hypothetical protein